MGKLRDTHLQALEFQVNSEPSEDEVRRAYRRLALQWHPDRNLNNTEAAAEEFKRVSAAYQFLIKTEAEQRREEAELEARTNPRPNVPLTPEDLFNMFFGPNAFRRQEVPTESSESSDNAERTEAHGNPAADEESEEQRRAQEEERTRRAEQQQARMDRVERLENNYNILFRAIFVAALTASVAYLVAVTLFIGAVATLAIFITSYLFELIHKKETFDFCREHAVPEDYEHINDETTKSALKAGTYARDYSGYLFSFVYLPAYRRRAAFDAAKNFACTDEQEIVAAIRRMP